MGLTAQKESRKFAAGGFFILATEAAYGSKSLKVRDPRCLCRRDSHFSRHPA